MATTIGQIEKNILKLFLSNTIEPFEQLALKHSIVCLMKMINPKQLAFYVGKLG
jgi:hypothetical protein